MMRCALRAAAIAVLFTGGAAHAEYIRFHGVMSTANEVPPRTTDGRGTLDAILETESKLLTYDMTYSGLTGPATMGHLHGPADPGENAGVLVPFTPPLSSPIHGAALLTDEQIADLMAGKVYANIHTAANPGGEIRGQLTK